MYLFHWLHRHHLQRLRCQLRELSHLQRDCMHHLFQLQCPRKLSQRHTRERLHLLMRDGLLRCDVQFLCSKLRELPHVLSGALLQCLELQQPCHSGDRNRCWRVHLYLHNGFQRSHMRHVRGKLRELPFLHASPLHNCSQLQQPRIVGQRHSGVGLQLCLLRWLHWSDVQFLCPELRELPYLQRNRLHCCC